MNLSINRVIKNWDQAPRITYTKDYVQNPVSFGRRFAKQNSDKELWQKSFAAFNLFPTQKELELGDLLMNHYQDNACTHIHKDPAPKGYVHIRANVMIKKPNKGGDIIVDNETIKVEENDLWLILASLENHGSTPIQKGERLIYSFGAVIKETDIKDLIKNKKRYNKKRNKNESKS
tara:strand:- start:7 stop:534 length:528 start_codon:yes stop_codon:yes gene_type:complete